MTLHQQRTNLVGRASGVDPPNRFERVRTEADWEHLDAFDEGAFDAEVGAPSAGSPARVATQFLPDHTQTLITHNESPDVPFRYSINPYRGCEHGCAYCYARPGHEYLGLNAGLDFETRILVKHEAPAILRRELADKHWQAETITLSGVTDCYQPAERTFKLTRGCLEVLLEARQPLGIITKNVLVARDLDLLQQLAAQRLVHVFLSLTTLDADLARTMEPRTATPEARLRAIQALANAGVPVGVMTAPVIPGLNDQELPRLLEAARDAGAQHAGYVLLRLPLAVRPIFEEWVTRCLPDRAPRVLGLVRETRGGRMNDPQFGSRMRGQGTYAAGIEQTFQMFRKKFGLDRPLAALDNSQFRPPRPTNGQLQLF